MGIMLYARSDKMSGHDSKIKSDEMELFFNAILKLENIEECYKFFEDVATINEVKALAQRIHVARLLSEKNTYTEIGEITGASTATISRINRCLNYGSDGYKLILGRLKEK
jgi:TrpR-related protein YerC/YecD